MKSRRDPKIRKARNLADARRLVQQACKLLWAIPTSMADLVDRDYVQRFNSYHKYDVALGLSRIIKADRPVAFDPGVQEGRRRAKSLLAEARSTPRSPAAPPRPAPAGAVRELVVRYRLRPIPKDARLIGSRITCSSDIYRLFADLRFEAREHIFILHMSAGNRLLSMSHAATGTLNYAHCSPIEAFRDASFAGASAIIVVHNHPSGRPQPSQGDLILLGEIYRLGQLCRIQLLDFVIIGDDDCYSASDHGAIARLGMGTLPATSHVARGKRVRAGSTEAAGTPPMS